MLCLNQKRLKGVPKQKKNHVDSFHLSESCIYMYLKVLSKIKQKVVEAEYNTVMSKAN